MLSTRVTGIVAGSLAGLAARYAAGRMRADRAWPVLVESRLGDIGEVDEVSVLPLVERLTPDSAPPGALRGEPGVSYLVRAGGTRLLFDTGLSGRAGPLGPGSQRGAARGRPVRSGCGGDLAPA